MTTHHQLEILEQVLKLRKLHKEMRETIVTIDVLSESSVKERMTILYLRNLIYADRLTVHETGDAKFWNDGFEILAGVK